MTTLLTDVAARHIAHLELAGRRAKTVNGYKYRWANFIKFIAETEGRQAQTTDCTREKFFEFFLARYSGLKRDSYMVYRSQVEGIGKFLMNSEFIPYGPSLESLIPERLPETDDRPERILSDDEFILLQEEAWKSHPRDFFFYWFLRLTGRRAGEALRIKWKDVSWRKQCVYWDNSKGRKFGKELPLTEPLRLMLEAWKDYYQWDVSEASLVPVQINPNWYLFPACTPTEAPRKGRRRDRRLNPTHFHTKAYDTIHDLLVRSGLYEEGMGHHSIRRVVIDTVKRVAQAANRGDFWEMARIAGDHQKVETTKRYVRDQEDYNEFAKFMHEFAMQLISPELARATSFLRGLVEEEPTPEPPQPSPDRPSPLMASTEVEDLLAEMGELVRKPRKQPMIRQ